MRKKDQENDYRFTVEADMPRVELSQTFLNEIEKTLPELPRAKKREREIQERLWPK